MKNAKDELIDHVKEHCVQILCAKIDMVTDEYFDFEPRQIACLKVGHSEKEYEEFLKSIDLEYNDGLGGQVIYGTIWYTDGTWSERGEYDGAEWWAYKKCPEVPASLQNKK